MCGIAGFIKSKSSDSNADQILSRMLARERHRGPDGEGKRLIDFNRWTIALGHRRLSIIDLEGGKQPLSNSENGACITYNGEVYNFRELRADLEKLHYRFTTSSDTEVVLNHFLETGLSGLRALNGMFAFAVWNADAGELTLVRDRAGIKPLYYSSTADGGLVFASELTALLEHPDIKRIVNVEGLARYFFSDYVHAPGTMIDGVCKLEPGHYVTWSNGQLTQPRAFWSLSDVIVTRPSQNEHELSLHLANKLKSAVKRQLVADVPIGVFLSGGIDSSFVAALAQNQSQGAIRTFSIGFEDTQYDESAYARLVAKQIGSHHTEEILREDSLFEIVEQALAALDEPMADPSILPTYLLSRLAARHVKVALGGDGGDELWAGYPTYRAHQFANYYDMVPHFIRRNIFGPLVSKMRVGDGYQTTAWKLKRFSLRWSDDAITRHFRWMSNTDLNELKKIFNESKSWTEDWARMACEYSNDALNNMLGLDFQTYMPGSVLTKVDRAAMAHGLEVRPPFLDNEMINWSYSLPSDLKLRGTTGKYLLKKAAENWLPNEIIQRRKKGFGIPLAKWIKGPLDPWLSRVFSDSPIWEHTSLNRKTFKAWQIEHLEGRDDHSKPLWALIVLDNWMQRANIVGCSKGQM
jgi:asparagine synthase (glutamine-hydrolysing)